MKYTSEINDFDDLKKVVWAGARHTLDRIPWGMGDRVMDYLEDYFGAYVDEPPTLTEINDYIWFESDEIFEALGMCAMSTVKTYPLVGEIIQDTLDYEYSKEFDVGYMRTLTDGDIEEWEEMKECVYDFLKDYSLLEEVIEVDEDLHVITIDSDIGDYIY